MAVIASGYTTSTAGALFGISLQFTTDIPVVLSKLHLLNDYHNLELRLQSAVTGDSKNSDFDVCSSAEMLLSTIQHFCKSKIRFLI